MSNNFQKIKPSFLQGFIIAKDVETDKDGIYDYDGN